MFNDSQTNCVVVADTLAKRYPLITEIIRRLSPESKAAYTEVPSNNIWMRDLMPVQISENEFTKFRYGYGSDNKDFKNLRLNKLAWEWLPAVKDCNLRLDGGNIVHHGGKVIMTDINFRHNRDVKRIVPRLERELQAEITVVPTEPGDDIGHTDGICKFTPDGKLLVHDYRMAGTKPYDDYFSALMQKLGNFECIVCPLASAKCPELTEPQFRSLFPQADTFNPGYGYYLNMLVVGKLVFVPQFNIEEDHQVMALVKRHFKGCEIIPVDCAQLSMLGGLLNCVSAQYKL